MIITEINSMNGADISSKDLLAHLSQLVLTKTDETIERKEVLLKENITSINETKTGMRMIKERLIRVSAEYKRLKSLDRLLNMIGTLKQEGVLVGRNRMKISKLLNRIQNQPLSALRSMEERLSLYLPENRSRVSIS